MVKQVIIDNWQFVQRQAGKPELKREWKKRNLKPNYVKNHTLNESREQMFSGIQAKAKPCYCRECKVNINLPQFFPRSELPVYRDLNEYQIPEMAVSLGRFTSEHIQQKDLMAIYRASYVLCHQKNIASENLQFWLENSSVTEMYEGRYEDSQLQLFEKLALLTLDVIVHNKTSGYINEELLDHKPLGGVSEAIREKRKELLATLFFDANATGIFIFIMSILVKNTFKETLGIEDIIMRISKKVFGLRKVVELFNSFDRRQNESALALLQSSATNKKIMLMELMKIFDEEKGDFFWENCEDVFKSIISEKATDDEKVIDNMLIASTAALGLHDQVIVKFFMVNCIKYIYEKFMVKAMVKAMGMTDASVDSRRFPSLIRQWMEKIGKKISKKVEKEYQDQLANDKGRENAKRIAEEQRQLASQPRVTLAGKEQYQEVRSKVPFIGILPRLQPKNIQTLLSALDTLFVPRIKSLKETPKEEYKKWQAARRQVNLYMKEEHIILLKDIFKLKPWGTFTRTNLQLTSYVPLTQHDANHNQSIFTFSDEEIIRMFSELSDHEKQPPYTDACKPLKEKLGYVGSELYIHILIWKLVGNIDWVMKEIASRSCPVPVKANDKAISQPPAVSALPAGLAAAEGLTAQALAEAQRKQGAIPKKRQAKLKESV